MDLGFEGEILVFEVDGSKDYFWRQEELMMVFLDVGFDKFIDFATQDKVFSSVHFIDFGVKKFCE